MLKKIIHLLLTRLVGKGNVARLITRLATAAEVNLLTVAHHGIGVMDSSASGDSPETFLVGTVLPDFLRKITSPVLFDVGANMGDYARLLRRHFADARIYAFEPNPLAHQLLVTNIDGLAITAINWGLGAEAGQQVLYTYQDEVTSGHATLYETVLTRVTQSDRDLIAVPISLTTLDDFCEKEGISRIDFLKIDTEGHELAVLKGASRMLREKRVTIIQFEFNYTNIASRVFLRDFYDLLPGYHFYRLKPRGLFPMPGYNPGDEIFKIQNILAVLREDVSEMSAYPQSLTHDN